MSFIKLNINKLNINKLFYIFLTAHLILWTLVPSLTNNNLPLDTIEALAWGSNLDWGFNKHPPAVAFFKHPPASSFFVEFFTKFLVHKIGPIIY